MSYDSSTQRANLLTATNPEQEAAIQYEYDANGNLTKRTDPDAIVTDHTYDELNRLASTLYASTPDVYRCYDGDTYNGATGCTPGTQTNSIGRLTEVGTVGVARRSFSYDQRGRITGSAQEFLGEAGPPSYAFSYVYNRG